MANTQAMCTQFKVDLLNGGHAFGAQPALHVDVDDRPLAAQALIARCLAHHAASAISSDGAVSARVLRALSGRRRTTRR